MNGSMVIDDQIVRASELAGETKLPKKVQARIRGCVTRKRP